MVANTGKSRQKSMRSFALAMTSVAIAHVFCGATSALEFNFIVDPGTPQFAIDGFVAAGERWSNVITDKITVNVAIAFGDIPSSTGATILGSTGSTIFIPPSDTTIVPDFLKLKKALKDDARSVHDRVAVANLPKGTNTLTALTNARDGSQFLDDDTSGNNTFFRVNNANAKAIGLLAGDASGEDASISFNSGVVFDFDPSDGITSGSTDFIGVATHEIGHALGFTSGVDLVDAFTGTGPSAAADLNGAAAGSGVLEPFALFSTLDLFRRSSRSLNVGPDVFDLSTTPGAYLSVNGNSSDLLLESGSFNGSGQQASHFLDNRGLGILDPTAGAGERLQITENDLLALDIIGYDVTTFGESNGFHNSILPFDVDASGQVTPLDALLVINELNDRQLSSSTGAINLKAAAAIFVDVNDNQSVTPLDALLVINDLNSPPANLSVTAVPEVIPSQWLALIVFFPMLYRRRRWRPSKLPNATCAKYALPLIGSGFLRCSLDGLCANEITAKRVTAHAILVAKRSRDGFAGIGGAEIFVPIPSVAVAVVVAGFDHRGPAIEASVFV